MRALVLSGGSGFRLRPFTHSMPKQLLPVANKPVLEHVISDIQRLGITDIGVIVGNREDQISAALGDGSRFGANLTYIRQERPLGLAHAVRLARDFLRRDDFVMYLGDNILADGIAGIVSEFRHRRPAAGLLVSKVSDPTAYGVAEVGPDGAVQRLVEKPVRPRSDLAVVGVYFFTAAIHEAVGAIDASARGEFEITDALQWLVTSGAQVVAREYRGFWRDVGRVDDLLSCNRRLLGELSPAVDGHVDPASYLRGRVVIEPGARVVRSRIDGPAIVGAASLVVDSRIGPGTSIGRDCTVRATELSDSIVLDGARITGTRGLHRSVVGRSASVGPAAPGGSAHRLLVADHARIELAAA